MTKIKNLPVKTGENRDEFGRFRKGHTGNPKGRPKGTRYLNLLESVIDEVENEKGESLVKRLVDRAYEDDKILMFVFNKILPNDIYSKAMEIKSKMAKEKMFVGMDILGDEFEDI